MKTSHFLTVASMVASIAAAHISVSFAQARNSSTPATPSAPSDSSSKALAAMPASATLDVSVAELMARPKDYVGKTVTVVSELEDVYGSHAFKLDEGQISLGGIDNDLLVVGLKPLPAYGLDTSWQNSKLRVTGKLHILKAEDFRRHHGALLENKLLRRYNNRPVLLAHSIMQLK